VAPSTDIISNPKFSNSQIVEQMLNDYKVVRAELAKYGKGLPEKKEIVVVNKMELVEEGNRSEIEKEFKKETGKDLIWVSAGMGEVSRLVEKLS
jgi:GTP-binding protein